MMPGPVLGNLRMRYVTMERKPPIYLDYNATTPVAPEVAEAMRPYLVEHFGNPSSSHWYGRQTKKAVTEARVRLATLLGCRPEQLIFTSGGSEANNLAIKGTAFSLRAKGNHIVTTAIEHPAVIEVCKYLETQGYRVTYLPVDSEGTVSVEEFRASITPSTILASVMHANNEVGTLQPIAELAAIARENGVVFHTDAAQSVGKIPVRVLDLKVHLLSVAGHKFYAPKGIGALYIGPGVKLEKLIHGASHEMGIRAGTENVLEIVGLGKAAEVATRDLESNMKHMAATRDILQAGLEAEIPDVKINGSRESRLPNTLSASFPRVEANTLLDEIGDQVAASAGAACHTDSIELSSVLKAMKVPEEVAMGTVRFSTGRLTTIEDIDQVLETVVAAVKRLKPSDPATTPALSDGDVKLTSFTHGLGCACKLRARDLEQVLSGMPATTDKNVLIGNDTADDAAVYKIRDDLAVVQTVDFFTPVVDDPYTFGEVAAANALSDLYAMGAKPIFALNIVGFPAKRLSLEVLRRILDGARSKTEEAGISIIGGHTIDDSEPKFGLAVTGTIDPAKILSNAGARPGDLLVLTKPIGTGIISTASKKGIADPATYQRAVELMVTLNKAAADVVAGYSVDACTDVTGFGLIGHLKEMVVASGVTAEVWAASVPVMNQVRELALAGAVPGGTINNLEFSGDVAEWDASMSEIDKMILCDAQTSGGLLIAVPEAGGEQLLGGLLEDGIEAAFIGRITGQGTGRRSIRILPERI